MSLAQCACACRTFTSGIMRPAVYGLFCVPLRTRCMPGLGLLSRGLVTRAERAAAQAQAQAKAGQPQISALFARLEAGLVGMTAENAGFRVYHDGASLVIDTGRDVLRVTGDAAAGQISYSSPKVGHGGGMLTYTLNPLSGEWVNTSDGHFLIELLTRELIFHVPGGLKGVPSW